jgi:hypothetical protein
MSEAKSQTKSPGDHWRKKEEGNLFKKIKIWIQRKIVDKEFLETLKKVGWELAQVFSYNILSRSTVKSKFKDQASEVHAYILLHHPKIYRRLIFDNRVIDLACLYAKKNFNPEILHWIKLEDLEDFRLSLMFIEEDELKNYAVRFNKVLVFTKEGFYDSVAMEEGVKLKWNNWETTGKRLSFNQALMAWIDYDLPLTIVTHTPGKHHLFYEADFDDVEKQHIKEQILTKAYHSAKVENALFEREIDKIKKLATMYAKQASSAQKLANRQKHKDWRAKINEIDRNKEEYRQQLLQKPSRVKQLTPFLITLTIIIGVLIFFWMFMSFQALSPPTSNPTPPEASLFVSNVLNLTKFRGC